MNTDLNELVQAINAFTLDFYSVAKEETQGNLFLSPLNIATALAMTYAGARGTTAEQMARVLHLPQGQAQLHATFGALIRDLKGKDQDQGYQLSIANSVWLSKHQPVLSPFRTILKQSYSSELPLVDFTNVTKSVDAINAWVAKHTQGKIRKLLDTLDPLTKLVLVSAIYFKGRWHIQFRKDQTRTAGFTLVNRDQVEVPMMRHKGDYKYFKTGSFKALELPYTGQRLTMVIFLPTEVDGLVDFERSLTLENLAKWLPRLSKRKLDAVVIPRFKLRTHLYPIDVLKSLSMTHAFSPAEADFSGITGQREIFISKAIHEAYVEVNEEGTEAAAATAVVAVLLNGNPTFYATHPFLFLIRDTHTGCILFLGRLVNPQET